MRHNCEVCMSYEHVRLYRRLGVWLCNVCAVNGGLKGGKP